MLGRLFSRNAKSVAFVNVGVQLQIVICFYYVVIINQHTHVAITNVQSHICSPFAIPALTHWCVQFHDCLCDSWRRPTRSCVPVKTSVVTIDKGDWTICWCPEGYCSDASRRGWSFASRTAPVSLVARHGRVLGRSRCRSPAGSERAGSAPSNNWGLPTRRRKMNFLKRSLRRSQIFWRFLPRCFL